MIYSYRVEATLAVLARARLLPGTDSEACHSERSEESSCASRILSAAKNDSL